MKKVKKKNKEIVFSVRSESLADFFARGKRMADDLDKGGVLQPRRIISFENSEDLIKFLNKTKLALFSAIRKHPDSISKLAKKLHRSRSAIDKDVQLLESIGIVESEYVINPGHGRCRIIKAVDPNPIRLEVAAII